MTHSPQNLRVSRFMRLCAVASWCVALALGVHAQESPNAGSQTGMLVGQVFDAATGLPLEGVTIRLVPSGPSGGAPRTETTDAEGAFEFRGVPERDYDLSYIKSGYRNSTMTGFAVTAGARNRADFPLPVLDADESGETLLLDEFVVEADAAAELLTSLETRLESDQLLNILSAEDFSKFAAGNVAEALERVAGVNIVDGQFAIIRGLEDRYSSTLYNGAPVPSPDPDRQSPQLDLFPSDVVSNLVVAKTFSSELSSNSAGGAINIVTHDYPDEVIFKLKAGTGWAENAEERFINFDGRTDLGQIFEGLPLGNDPEIFSERLLKIRESGFRSIGGSPVGREDEKNGNFRHDVEEVIEGDFTAFFGGRKEFGGREFRLKAVAAKETDYSSQFGVRESLEPIPSIRGPDTILPFDLSCFCVPPPIPGEVEISSDLALGQLSLTGGRFDETISEWEQQLTAYVGFGFDLDDSGNHRIDGSVLWTEAESETVRFRENGFLPGFDYTNATLLQLDNNLSNRPDVPFFRDVTTRGSSIARGIREGVAEPLSRGALVFTNFFQSATFQRERELKIYQINGDHVFEDLDGLHVSWLSNWSETRQEEVSLGLQYFFEPCGFAASVPCAPGASRIDPTGFFPEPAASGEVQELATRAPSLAELGAGVFAHNNDILLSATRIDEQSRFTRLDLDHDFEFTPASTLEIGGGLWWERADRNVEAAFLTNPTINQQTSDVCAGAGSQFACTNPTPGGLGSQLFQEISTEANNFAGLNLTSNDSSRDIFAWHARAKLTLWERLDLFGGVRREHIEIESRNDPFLVDPVTGEPVRFLEGPSTFPSRFLFFDRFDNDFTRPAEGGGTFQEAVVAPASDAVFNDEILGLTTADPTPCEGDPDPNSGRTCVDLTDEGILRGLFNGRIDEKRYLPHGGLTFRPTDWMTWRAAYSKTVARPSFRELGYYVTVEPGSNDLVVGNPQLGLSDVTSWDARLELNWGEYGDLFAVSIFQKDIERPIESIIVRDPSNLEESDSALYRTFFNNPNQADLWGIEVEVRKAFDFLGVDFLNYLSIGGNYTWIDAEVDRTEAELARARPFFSGLFEGDDTRPADRARYLELEPSRRLFNQPRWILNADISFDHPEWGTRFTVAYFKISDVLNAAGTATLAPNGDIRSFTLDRYVDSFHELRATFSQTFDLAKKFGAIKFSLSAKNLTDSRRRVLYDTSQLRGDFEERNYRVGRDYSISLEYSRTF